MTNKWVTFFGQETGHETIRSRARVEAWAKDNDVDFLYKEVDAATRAEYNLQVVPTLRAYDARFSKPRLEFKGAPSIISVTQLEWQ